MTHRRHAQDRPRGGPHRGVARLQRTGRATPKPRPERAAVVRGEVVTVGRELLRGSVSDQNAPHVAAYLAERGVRIERITVVDDSEWKIADVVLEALERGIHLVVTTGGLGPAADDRTLAAVARALQRPLTIQPGARRMVEQAYRRLESKGLTAPAGLNVGREKMCAVPVGCEPIPNPVGVAPGVLARLPGGGVVLCLPGAPEEAGGVLEEAALRLKDLLVPGFVAHREVETPITDESRLRPLVDRLAAEYPKVWIQSHAPGFGHPDVHVRVTLETRSGSRHEAEALVEAAVRRLLDLAGTR